PSADLPEMALHAFRFDVIDKKGLFFGDDIYAYYYVTDGLVPQGKVTEIYKNVKSCQAFFFNANDRVIFPGAGIVSATPSQHLIIDMGIIESNKDDIAQMQKISDVIIDLVIAVYGTQNPNTGAILLKLRQEIKALARELIALKKDDRL